MWIISFLNRRLHLGEVGGGTGRGELYTPYFMGMYCKLTSHVGELGKYNFLLKRVVFSTRCAILIRMGSAITNC
jgi:hypothetical protein